jgi:uncharacterized DUF497 family protein
MDYEWDPAKAAANLAKHGIAFARAALFDWQEALTEEDDRQAYGERRFYALGLIEGLVHALIFTRRGISLRMANDREQRRYEHRAFSFLRPRLADPPQRHAAAGGRTRTQARLSTRGGGPRPGDLGGGNRRRRHGGAAA